MRAILGMVILGLLAITHTAKADPHAMFYTVSGQQQLFFNTLAALDQADYVEPQEDRQRLLETRGNPQTDPELKSTETQQASILTRGVTLEGQDLWSSYQKFQFALEATRRKDTSALLTYFCQRALGLKNCKENEEEPKIAEARLSTSFDKQPNAPQAAAERAGINILRSGDPYDQQKRQDLITGKTFDPANDLDYNPAIAQFHQQTGSDPIRKSYLNGLIASVGSLSFGNPDASALNDLVNENGTVSLPEDAKASDATEKLASLVSLPNQFLEARMAAEDRRTAFNNETRVNGAKADTYPVPRKENGQIGLIEGNVRVPAYIKASEGEGLAQGLNQLAGNPDYAISEENIPGQTRLVDRGGSNNQQGQGNVQGISSDSALLGRVLAASDDTARPPEDGDPLPSPTPEPPLNLNTKAIRSLDERPIHRILEQLVGGSNRGGCACSIYDVLGSYGGDIIEKTK